MRLFRYSYTVPFYPVGQAPTAIIGEVTAKDNLTAREVARRQARLNFGGAVGQVTISKGKLVSTDPQLPLSL